MGSIALGILFVAAAGIVGGSAGWWLRGSGAPGSPGDFVHEELERVKREAQASKQAAAEAQKAVRKVRQELDEAKRESGRAKESLAQLHRLAERMAADVDQHNTRVQEITDELGSQGHDAQSVIGAIAKLVQANAKMQERLENAEERLKDQAQQIETHVVAARTDPLTGLSNRRAFDAEIGKCLQAFQERGEPVSVMLIDVDHFKKFNDTHGHAAGDEVLQGVGRVLTDNLMDAGTVCRYGGEEFAVIFAGSGVEFAKPAAERARAAISATCFEYEGVELRVTASAGLAELIPDESAETLVKRSDAALYAGKEAGRNCGFWHDGKSVHAITRQTAANASRKVESKRRSSPAPAPADLHLNPEDDPGANEKAKDTLTGLSTKAVFLEDIRRRLAEWRRGGAAVSTLLIEVDRFPNLVAAHGDRVAAGVLRATAQFMKASMREMDHIARFDGKRFALLLPGACISDALNVAERLRVAIENCKLPAEGDLIRFTISLGVAEALSGDTDETLTERAARSLRLAIQKGGNCSCSTTENDLSELMRTH